MEHVLDYATLVAIRPYEFEIAGETYSLIVKRCYASVQ